MRSISGCTTGGHLVVMLTDIYGQHFTQRAVEVCPDLTTQPEVLPITEEMGEVCDFSKVGSGFATDTCRLPSGVT